MAAREKQTKRVKTTKLPNSPQKNQSKLGKKQFLSF